MTKILPFEKLLKMSDKEFDESLVEVKCRKFESQANGQLADIDTDLIKAEQALQTLLRNPDLSMSTILNKQDEIRILEHRKKSFVELMGKLFPKSK